MVRGQITKFVNGEAKVMNVEEILNATGMNFHVEKDDMFVLNDEIRMCLENDLPIPTEVLQNALVTTHAATVRKDSNGILGVVGKDYGVIQNHEAFKFIDLMNNPDADDTDIVRSLNDVGGITIETAGALNGGSSLFICAKMNNPYRMLGNPRDEVNMNIVAYTSHDGTGGMKIAITPIRVVCMNTLNMALRSTQRITFKHSKFVGNRIDLEVEENRKRVITALQLGSEYYDAFDAKMRRLAQIKLTQKQCEEILAKAVMSKDAFTAYTRSGNNLFDDDVPTRGRNIVTSMLDATESGVGQDLLEGGNGLWLVNGISTYFQNHTKEKSEAEKFSDSFEGNAAKKLQLVTDLIEEVA